MTEHEIQNQILRTFGTRSDLRLWRTNTGVARMGNRRVRFGVPGMADIHGILPMRAADGHIIAGLYLAIEVKSDTGRQTVEQAAYQAMIEKFGGVYVLARDVKDVWQAIGKYLTPVRLMVPPRRERKQETL